MDNDGASPWDQIDAGEQLERKAYYDLIKYVRWMGKTFSIPGHWLLNSDDVMAEALYALARCMKKYLLTKPYDEFLILAKVSMKNAIGTLKYKACLTHRKAELSLVVSLDEPSVTEEDCTIGDTIPGDVNVEAQYDSLERMENLVTNLSPFSVKVLDAVLGGEPRVRMCIKLRRDRLNFVNKNSTIAINPLILARALCEPEAKIRGAYKEIRSVLKELTDG